MNANLHIRYVLICLALAFWTDNVHGATITFAESIATIFHSKCVECHKRGGAAPFSLVTYEDVTQKAQSIRNALAKGTMPPWLPAGELHKFQGDRRLSQAETHLLDQWFNQGMPQGEFNRMPLPPHFAQGWKFGTPPVVLQPQLLNSSQLPEANVLVSELPKERDLFVSAVELMQHRPTTGQSLLWIDLPMGARGIEPESESVTNVKSWFIPKKLSQRLPMLVASPFRPVQRARAVEARDRRLLGVWSNESVAQCYPTESAFHIPAGSRLVLQHTAPVDQKSLELGLHSTEIPAKQNAMVIALEPRVQTSNARSEQPWTDFFMIPVACELHALAPVANTTCHQIRVNLTLPSGKTESLLWIDAWQPRWGRNFVLQRPVQIPANSRIDVQYLYERPQVNAAPESSLALLSMTLVPVQPQESAELVRAMQRHQIQLARLPAW